MDFWANFSSKIINNWAKFFQSNKNVFLEDVNNEMNQFLHKAIKITQIEWVLFKFN